MREFDLDEIEELSKLVEETNEIDLKLDGTEIRAIHQWLRKSIKTYITSSLQLHTLKGKSSPMSCYVNLKVDHFKDNIIETIEKALRCVAPPYKVFIDFFCLATSATKPDYYLIHPSAATAYNEQQIILKIKDREKLLDEFEDNNFCEKVLENHHLVRRYFKTVLKMQ